MEILKIEEMIRKLEDSAPTIFLDKVRERREGTGFILTFLSVHMNEVVYSKDLAEDSGLSTARIAAALNKLEENNFIERFTCGEDKRKTIVRLTEEGKAKCKKMRDDLYSFFEKVINSVGQDKINQFLLLGKEINEAAKNVRKERENNVQTL